MTEKERSKFSLSDHIRLLKSGDISENDFMSFLKDFPYTDIGDIKLDLHRSIRRGLPEVIYGEHKNNEQLKKIIERLKKGSENMIITRVSREKYLVLKKWYPGLLYHEKARILTFKNDPVTRFSSPILILSAGSSDEPVAEEAYVTSRYLGNKVDKEYDVGVACLSRILDLREKLNHYGVIIVIAGMEGALPSVVAGLTSTPVIAVPTSVGYGANFDGLAALLSMLNACAGGVSVVNINNGFGAAFQATLINQKICCPS